MDYQLVVTQGRNTSQTLKLGDGVTTVGRQEDCQLRIRSSQVSRKHCELFEKKGLLLLKDLGSSNGTHVNGKKVDGQRVLEPGDILTIGNVTFRVEKVGAAAPAPAAAKPVKTGKKPADTAVAEAALGLSDATVDDEEFEIDFDEGPVKEDATTSVAPAKTNAKAKVEPAPKTQARPKAVEEPAAELADDAVADFLMNINLDDDDK